MTKPNRPRADSPMTWIPSRTLRSSVIPSKVSLSETMGVMVLSTSCDMIRVIFCHWTLSDCSASERLSAFSSKMNIRTGVCPSITVLRSMQKLYILISEPMGISSTPPSSMASILATMPGIRVSRSDRLCSPCRPKTEARALL